MGGLALFFFYGSILFCIIASVVRMTKYTCAPLHLRWELHRGSSVYELTDWWKRSPRRFGEKLRGVILDILFLREFYHRNRSFWYFLFLFHWGFYLIILWHLWLFITAVTLPFESAIDRGGSFRARCHRAQCDRRDWDSYQTYCQWRIEHLLSAHPLFEMVPDPPHPGCRISCCCFSL